MTSDDQDSIRRRINLRLAIRCAEVGLHICPAANKTPLIPDWTRPDTLAADDTRNARVANWKAKHGKAPPHVGCTTDVQIVRKLWKAYPDAVPLISLGPSGLLVLDPDRKNGGPQKIGQLFREHGFDAKACPVTRTRDGGRHIYFRNNVGHGNTEGAFSEYGTNVKGIGGQVIAPGAIREDGKRYAADPNYPSLFDAIMGGTLPDVPQFVISMLKRGGDKTQVSDKAEARTIAELEGCEWPDADAIRDPLLGYDVDHLRRVDANFDGVLGNPHSDTSKNRLAYANAMLREWPHMSVTEYAALVTTLDGAGTPNYEYTKGQPGDASNRELAREYLKAKVYAKARPASAGVNATADEDIGEAPADNVVAIRALRTLRSDLALGLIDDRTYGERRKRVVTTVRDTSRAISQRIADIKKIAGIDTLEDDEKDDNEREPVKRTRRGVSVSELTARGFQPVEYLWRDLLAANTVTMIYGHAGASKTSLVINEAMPHAFGFDRDGNEIERFGTIFVALESVDDTHNLILAWLRANPRYQTFGTEAAFTVVNGVGWGLHDRQLKKTELERHLEKEIKEFPARFGVQPRVVVIDTAAMSVISDGGEESNESVNRVLSAANKVLAKLPRGAVVFLGHTGKDEKTYRGAVSWQQGTQGLVRMERRAGKVTISIERLKGAASGARFACQSNAVPMGVSDTLGREAVAYVLSERTCVRNPNSQSDGQALGVADDEVTDAAPLIPDQHETPAPTADERKAQEIAALADEAAAVLKASASPLKREQWSAEILAKRLEGVKGSARKYIGEPPEKKLRVAIKRLLAERRVVRHGDGKSTTYGLQPG